jgi:acyl-coenzyme A thioesterase PaaI-like protein
MNAPEEADLVVARTALAKSLQRLGHSLVAYEVTPIDAHDLADRARSWADRVVTGRRRDRSAELLKSPRFEAVLRGDAEVLADGQQIDLFRDSVVSGTTNPMGIGLQAFRRGDTAVATTVLGPAFEGAPGRAHGGVIGAILDETMGFVLPIIGVAAYTANLNIDYLAPAPVEQELTFTARLRDRADRKLWIEATGESADGPFVRAEALFLTVDFERFSNRTATQ